MSTNDPALSSATPTDTNPSADILAICRKAAWDLYKASNFEQAAIVARGLVAADPSDWYHHALFAATLQKQRRFVHALARVDDGLAQVPGQADLLELRAAIAASAERLADAERKLGIALPPVAALGDDDVPVASTPEQKRRAYLEMIRLVTTVFEAQDEAITASFRSLRV